MDYFFWDKYNKDLFFYLMSTTVISYSNRYRVLWNFRLNKKKLQLIHSTYPFYYFMVRSMWSRTDLR